MKTKQTKVVKKTTKSPDEWGDVHSLIGKFFHSIKDGKLEWQGRVVGEPEPCWYLVVLFVWLTGSEGGEARLVRFSDMTEWLFYPDIESMRLGYECGPASNMKGKE